MLVRGSQYETRYEDGNRIHSWIGRRLSRVVDRNDRVVFEGRDVDCLRYLAGSGDRIAQRELRHRKDA
jgi:hypothetical protein